MTNIITFTDTIGVPEEYRPVPASKIIPDWYKNLESYTSDSKKPDGNANTTATAKRCMPIFDAIGGGYLILTHTDIFVSQKEIDYKDQTHFEETGETISLSEEKIIEKKLNKTTQHYEWANFGAISFHPKVQLPEHPDGNGHAISYPKWNNAWSISTPPGYSTLFISPLHRETPIIVLPGVVDTDTYKAPVNFPFVLRNPEMEGLIPAGTPIMQVIPFKREEWKMEIGSTEQLEEQYKITSKLRSVFFDSYKRQYRQPKVYR